MKKSLSKILIFLLAGMLILSSTGCGKKKFTITAEEKEQGYRAYKDMGLKFKMSDVWKEYDDNLVVDRLGDEEDESNPIYTGRNYGFISNELIEKYYDVIDNVENKEERNKKIDEIFSQVKNIFSIAVFRKDKLPAEDKIAELTKMDHNEKISTISEYVFYFCRNDYDDTGLSEEAKKGYKAMFDDVENIKSSLTVYKPMTPQESITGMKKLEFSLKDLEGNDVTDAIFKDNKLTMINIWGTFCGPCKREMPDLQALYEELKDEQISIIGIISDTPNPENEDAARQIIESSGVKFINLIPDDNIKNNLLTSISGVPTSFFVDSNGKIVGEVITGSISKEEYQEKMLEALQLLK
ncbi:TlpA family protein disulfide reductase [Tissierella sp. MSJ-40]|uniref:TlpA family protein disulfide reductase n=1 Tax=Tissierella simiarum TaxID=2841534 RepID=A0ABS6E8G6_9FIRM|nr:TlpA disulfide reductase family protein [Tissierella simiarum]MBU5438846.1 TlpA family protein disulfide reductase [Tissierella simiarum]